MPWLMIRPGREPPADIGWHAMADDPVGRGLAMAD
jgi:hypothetical protein